MNQSGLNKGLKRFTLRAIQARTCINARLEEIIIIIHNTIHDDSATVKKQPRVLAVLLL